MTDRSEEDSFDIDINDHELIEKYILNENNKFVSDKFINSILKKYGLKWKIKNLDMFRRALTHTSYLKLEHMSEKNIRRYITHIKEKEVDEINPKMKDKAIPLQDHSYERLEFLGDSVIRTVLSDYMFFRYTNQDEGFMTRLRTKIEKGETLALLTKAVGLNEYIIMSKLIDNKNGRNQNVSILEDVFEAFIGALYIESSFDTCKLFIVKVIEEELDIAELLHKDDNYKALLLQLYHRLKWDDPKYSSLATSGNDNKKEFTMCVRNNDQEIIGIGTGTSKKKGEQEAARRALIKLGELNEDSDSESESDVDSNYDLCSNVSDGDSESSCDYDITSDSD